MGGCRCSYKNCIRATKNSEKDFHFFHYPVKDPERCLRWITNARKPTFFNLPEDQLRNKVICQNHFEIHYFTNANRKRLIHNAVPTLDIDCLDPKESMCIVQVLQSDVDASVFTVDTNLMSTNVSEVRSFLIENGDIVPANVNQEEPQVIPQIEIVRPFKSVTDNNVNNNYKIEDNSENTNRNELSVKSEPELLKIETWETILIDDNPRSDAMTEKSDPPIIREKKKAKVKLPVLKNSIDIDSLSRTVGEHSKEIATLKRLLNMRIQRAKQKKHKQKMQILGKLHTLLPPTLHALVNLHVLEKQDNFTKEEKRLLTLLFKASPSTYEVLLNDCKWKLPSATIVRNLTNNGNDVR